MLLYSMMYVLDVHTWKANDLQTAYLEQIKVRALRLQLLVYEALQQLHQQITFSLPNQRLLTDDMRGHDLQSVRMVRSS